MADAIALRREAGVSALPFVGAAFIGAALIFLVQPMFARMATPLLGGAPAVWNVSLVCFQGALLGGYAYAHLLSRLKSGRMQVFIHAAVLVAGLLCLPLRISGLMGEPDADHPTLWLLGTFALSIAPPFAALSATAPLIQHWYAKSGREDAADPYHLYAASNIGSMLGLAAYPLLIEPFTRLADQSMIWTVGYVFLAATLLFAGWTVSRNAVPEVPLSASDEAVAKPTWRQRGIWLAFSFAPSSLLVGATSHITTDVAAAPFLWAPPLMLYLLTFVIAFGKKPLIPHQFALVLAPLAAAMAAFMLSGRGPKGIAFGMGADLFALFMIALACHGALNIRRPAAKHLTEFYLLMSLGGVLGGAFNALVAPVIFDNVLEYPLMLIASLVLLSIDQMKLEKRTYYCLGAGVVALGVAIAAKAAGWTVPFWLQAVLITPSLAAVILSRRAPLGAAIGLALAIPTGWSFSALSAKWEDRSFFGVVRIVDDARSGARFMMHGTTLHGAQTIDGDVLRPRTYYAPEAPIGQTLALYNDAPRVGVVGLGIGGSACYSQLGQHWTFFEIDPLVVEVATNRKMFTFISGCEPDAPIVVGDARMKIAAMPANSFDFLLLDAFSSDSLPTHLITREAMQLYFDKLSPDGVLVFNISNRHMALAPVMARIAKSAGAHILFQTYIPDAGAKARGAFASKAVIVSRSDKALERARATGKWQELTADNHRPWTDDYSNVIGAMIDQMQSAKKKAPLPQGRGAGESRRDVGRPCVPAALPTFGRASIFPGCRHRAC